MYEKKMLVKLYNITLKYYLLFLHFRCTHVLIHFGFWFVNIFTCYLFVYFFPLSFLLKICIYFVSSSAFLIMTEYLDCRQSFILIGFIYCWIMNVLKVKIKPNVIHFACRRTVEDNLWDENWYSQRDVPWFYLESEMCSFDR